MGRRKQRKDDLSEDYCFICKDGGHLRVCDYKNCLKSYHPQCLEKDPSFLESNERWTCGWHTCFSCQNSSVLQCYCCPYSVCRACISTADFVQVKKKTRGFCSECLSMTILIEEKKIVYSDGREVDFEDRDTCEFLFKDYWRIIKNQEGLKLTDLQTANALLISGKHCKSGSDSGEEDDLSEYNETEDVWDDEVSNFKSLKVKPNKPKMPKSRGGSKKRMFIGWGSVELINFLASIGLDTKEPLTQLDACEIIKKHIKENNLFSPDNKKNVICDDALHSLFRRKKLKYHKIYNLVACHLAENNHSSDEFSFSSEEVDSFSGRRKRQKTNSSFKLQRSNSQYIEPPKSIYASIVAENINAVYLRRSLVIDLLKSPMSFEKKVTSCFVRIKNDPKDLFSMHPKVYQLGQVTGVKKVPQAYKIGEALTDFVLCVSNIPKDVQISLLSDEDFEEEECEDLRQLVKEGLLRKPTVVEMEEKITIVHEDITNHWIDRELKRLEKKIEKANEKGWRKELFEYIDERQKLKTLEGRQGLLNKNPQVIADALDDEAGVDDKQTSDREFKAGDEVIAVEDSKEERYKGNEESREDKISRGGNSATKIDPLSHQNEGDNADPIQQENQEETPLKHKEISQNSITLERSVTLLADTKGDKEIASCKKTSEIPVIDLLDDDDKVWHYVDPFGKQQGPFDMKQLIRWNNGGYFSKDFKVWRTDQSKEDAIFLTDAIRLCQ